MDHLVPLELGGSNDIGNLWPEVAEPRPGFHEKDKVENYLHEQVCSGAISLKQAQAEIAGNWPPAWVAYLAGSLKGAGYTDLTFIDAMTERLDEEQVRARLREAVRAGERPEDGALELPDVGPFPGDQRPAGIGGDCVHAGRSCVVCGGVRQNEQ